MVAQRPRCPNRPVKVEKRSLWEQGIQPGAPVWLKYFNKERWAFVKVLWQSYREKWLREPVEAKAAIVRAKKVQDCASAIGFDGMSSAVMDEARWTLFWSWRRVAEDERARTYEERLEYRQRELKT